jgi:hypothetical protein
MQVIDGIELRVNPEGKINSFSFLYLMAPAGLDETNVGLPPVTLSQPIRTRLFQSAPRAPDTIDQNVCRSISERGLSRVRPANLCSTES